MVQCNLEKGQMWQYEVRRQRADHSIHLPLKRLLTGKEVWYTSAGMTRK